MEPGRRPAGRRVLLPAEAELCNVLGLNEEDYWYFVALTDAYSGQRDEAYELVPDVRNDPVSIIITLAVGVALQAVSALLAPKPADPQQKTPPQTRTADIKGRDKFAPQDRFDSVQQLANLGAVIPLVFTRRGVRVTSQLLWSQLLSEGLGQQLKAITLFSLGQIERKPDFAGFAIGDTLLESYTNAKLALYFRPNGGRLTEEDRYDQGTLTLLKRDPFSVYWDQESAFKPYFSGARNPATQAQFGVYQPIPNGMMWRPNYELILKPKNADNDLKDDIDRKQDKVYRGKFPLHCAVISQSSSGVKYRIDSHLDGGSGYQPWGTQDVTSAEESAKVDTDDALQVGELYMVGTRTAVCTSVNSNEPWEKGLSKDYDFSWNEGAGVVDVPSLSSTDAPYQRLTILRCAVGTITNNRACHVTEIGLKSTVWKQINGFANVNSWPGETTIKRYERDNGSFTLGSLNKYVTRLSFFTLQGRELGKGAEWVDISGGALFCVKGQTPQAQYNFIRISQPFGQHEYRLMPYSGNAVHRYWLGRDVWLLKPGPLLSYTAGRYRVAFAGQRFQLNDGSTTNNEWFKGTPPKDPSGAVIGLSSTSNGDALPEIWVLDSVRYDVSGKSQSYVMQRRMDGPDLDEYWWDTYLGTQPLNTPFLQGDYRYTKGARRGKIPDTAFDGYEIKRERYILNPVIYKGVVSATGGKGTGLQVEVTQYKNGATSWHIVSGGMNYINGEYVTIPVANVGVSVKTSAYIYAERSLNLFDAISDYVLYDAESASHISGPEHEVAYVNEQVQQSAPQYPDLALGGIRLNSSKEWGSFSELSAYFTRGVVVERLIANERSATNLLPEIAYALLTDPRIGAGKLIGAQQVDRSRMALAAEFCNANGFYWDGVLDQRENLRQWIFEQAGYCLLDFTILGGQFSLVPSVPFHTSGAINREGKPAIKALFTDGNVKNLQVSFLSPEERQLFRATLLWRQELLNGFPETRVISVRLADSQGGSDSDPEETFDMSGFCTSQDHALTFARYALKTRQLVDHGLKFETTPQAAMNLAPGEYFRLVSEATHTSRFQNGVIGPDGTVQMVDGSTLADAPILYWEPGTTAVRSANLTVVNGRTNQTALFGTVFTLSNSTTVSRVYKVESLTYIDGGLVEVAGSHTPLTSSGTLAVLDWNPSHFLIEAG